MVIIGYVVSGWESAVGDSGQVAELIGRTVCLGGGVGILHIVVPVQDMCQLADDTYVMYSHKLVYSTSVFAKKTLKIGIHNGQQWKTSAILNSLTEELRFN